MISTVIGTNSMFKVEISKDMDRDLNSMCLWEVKETWEVNNNLEITFPQLQRDSGTTSPKDPTLRTSKEKISLTQSSPRNNKVS